MKTRISLLLTGIMLVISARATPRYVVMPGTPGTPTPNYTTWATAATNIQDAVSVTVDNDVVWVSNGTYKLTGQITITNGIAVRGFGGQSATFINGNYPGTITRAFQLSHTNAVVDGFTITNCLADNGGAVYIQTNGSMVNCTLAFNQSTNNGYDNKGGGAVFLNSGGLLTNCVVSNNTANLGVGGGAFLYKGGVLSNCTFVVNTASNATGYAGAGAYIQITAAGQTSRVTGCVFSNNSALYQGGGLMLNQAAGAVDAVLIDACTFVTNTAGGYGGGVRLAGGGIVSNCIIINNRSLEHGGGAYISGGRIVNCTNISGNVATNSGWGGGGIFLVSGGRAENCRVTGNLAGRGGGIRYSGSIVVTGCVMLVNTGTYGGAGLWAEGSGWTVQDCVFSNNNSANYGGGITVAANSGNTGTIQRCEFVNNSASGGGGGIDLSGTGNNEGFIAVIQDCVFRGNSANGYPGGGGIYYPSGTGRVENCRFMENRSANAWAGAGGYFGAGVRVRNCLFTKNVAVSYGGGAYLVTNGNNGGEFTACTVVSNKGGTGGGLYLSGTNNVLLNSVIYSNAATTSNDLYLASDPANNTLTYNCTTVSLPGQGNITNNPQFADFTTENFSLGKGSPCISAGSNQNWMIGAKDLDNRSRIDRFSGRVDIGAYELLPSGVVFMWH